MLNANKPRHTYMIGMDNPDKYASLYPPSGMYACVYGCDRDTKLQRSCSHALTVGPTNTVGQPVAVEFFGTDRHFVDARQELASVSHL